MQKLIEIPYEFWLVLGEMAPYLLFGFFIAGILYVFVPQDLIYKHLGKKGLLSSLKAAIIGIPIPLCSCGVIPVAASLRKNGASREATTAFLISTPQTGVDSILVTFSLLGLIFAVFRTVAAFISGVLGGWLVGLFTSGTKDEDQSYNHNSNNCDCDECREETRIKQAKFAGAMQYGFVTLPRDIGKALVIGLLIAAGIAAFVPDDFFMHIPVRGFAMMIVMMLVGVPVYVCATASVPVAAMLIAKGISPGAALVFLMTGPATNAATVAVIWKTMGRKTAVLYIIAVAVTALGSGLILDHIYMSRGGVPEHMMHQMFPIWFNAVCAIVLILVLINAMLDLPFRKKKAIAITEGKTISLKVNMSCSHCADQIRQALSRMHGVKRIDIELPKNVVHVNGEGFDSGKIISGIQELGFKTEVINQSKEK